jgi:hypothetical protein
MPSSASRPFGLCNSSECILRVKPPAHATSSNRVINAVMDSRDVLWVAPTGQRFSVHSWWHLQLTRLRSEAVANRLRTSCRPIWGPA